MSCVGSHVMNTVGLMVSALDYSGSNPSYAFNSHVDYYEYERKRGLYWAKVLKMDLFLNKFHHKCAALKSLLFK